MTAQRGGLPPRAVTVATGVAAFALVGALALRGLTSGAPAWQLAAGAALGWWAVDAIVWAAHWTLDNYFSPTTPIVGPSVGFFREHHGKPEQMFGRDYFDGNFENALTSLLLMGGDALLLPAGPTDLAFASLGLGGSLVTSIHKWAHRGPAPAPIRALQRARMLVSPAHHATHHREPSRAYALVSGQVEPVIEAMRLPILAEGLVWLLTGAVAQESRLGLPAAPSSLRDRLQRLQWRAWYELLARYSRRQGARYACMNWGYAEEGLRLDVPADLADERLPLQLYAALARGVDLAGAHVLDASCGRGGGLSFLHRTGGAARSVGVDMTPANLDAARSAFAGQGIEFRAGDAEALPAADASADVVLSVEASHCYPHVERFVSEAARVLRPGGHLLWTDFREGGRPLGDLPASDWEVLEARDITAHVLAAMAEDGERRRRLIREHFHPLVHGLLSTFAASDESADTVRRFREKRAHYLLVRARRRP